MKILFIGVGLTDYTNQILNKLQKETGFEIFNLIDSTGKGHTGVAVHQTDENVNFKIVSLPQIDKKLFTHYKYKGFSNFITTLKEIHPDIIVATETYMPFLMQQDIDRYMKTEKIKIAMKDIPFRLEKYDLLKEKITNGFLDKEYRFFVFQYIEQILNRFKLGIIYYLVKMFCKKIGLVKLINIYYGRNILLKKLELKKKLLNYPDAHVDYVEEAYEIFESYGVDKKKIFIMYNSPDTDLLFEIRKKNENEVTILPKNDHRIIHIGRLIEWKRVDMLIRSISDLKKRFKDIELLIIGTGPEENKLRKIVSDLNIEDSVKFLGGIYKSEEIGKYLLSSTVYVLAGMGGISINDAMAFGKPIICSVCDGTEKKLVYNNRNGFYFKDGDQNDLTDKISKLISDYNLVQRFGNASTEIIRKEINIHTVIKGYTDAFKYMKEYER